VQVEIDSSARSDPPETTSRYAALSHELSTGPISALRSAHLRANPSQELQPSDRTRPPFRPFTEPASPPQAHATSHSPTSRLNADHDDDDDWTRLPPIDNSRLSFTQPRNSATFSPYYPNLSHTQVAAAAGYRSDPEQGLARPAAATKHAEAADIGVARTSSIGDFHDDVDDIESDCRSTAGGGRPRDEDLVDVLQMFQESRIRKMELVKGRAKVVDNK